MNVQLEFQKEGGGEIFEDIMAKIFPNLMRTIVHRSEHLNKLQAEYTFKKMPEKFETLCTENKDKNDSKLFIRNHAGQKSLVQYL